MDDTMISDGMIFKANHNLLKVNNFFLTFSVTTVNFIKTYDSFQNI